MKPLFISYKEIDKLKWDKCIGKSKNSLIYAYSFYLDAMANEQWDAIVSGDYEVVMPLPWRKKYAIKYLYQPAFVQQLGIFSAKEILPAVVKLFIQEMQKHFRFADYTLNAGNNLHDLNLKLNEKINFIIDLSPRPAQVSESYNPAFLKSLRRLQKWDLQYSASNNIDQSIELYKKLYFTRLKEIQKKDLENFRTVCKIMSDQNKLHIRVVKLESETLALSVLLQDDKRIYNIISCITEKGKKLEANYFLYDKVIQEFSDSSMLFDLEGSDVPGIAAFYKKMNPQKETYHFMHYNNLSPLVKIFKP